MNQQEAKSLLASAQCIATMENIELAVAEMAVKINARLQDSNPIVLVIMTGGLIFSGHLLPKLNFPLEIDYLQANRYEKNLAGGDINWRVEPKLDVRQRCVLILDDILDEGITLGAVSEKIYDLGASEVLSAVLINKQLSVTKVIQADFIGMDLPDLFLFGFGLDVFGYWRNLPDIYALSPIIAKDF
ncbi:MAG: hypoxanthine-guanine phosphoribosyltransferase [Proteobacteria bacterium]|nr:hypoxanthine-guanine phosphoribosyltransferase [Pseudomonadota bacterium]MDE3208772.1 hypoxanthine-guanine phosphoribosyltransferase [Pseudomonadota bacterium]